MGRSYFSAILLMAVNRLTKFFSVSIFSSQFHIHAFSLQRIGAILDDLARLNFHALRNTVLRLDDCP